MYATDPALSEDSAAFAGNVSDSFQPTEHIILAQPCENLSLTIGRGIDVTLAVLALIAVLPVLILLCGITWLQDGANPIFVHKRIGRGGRSFPCLKIRTMVRDADARLHDLLGSDPDDR